MFGKHTLQQTIKLPFFFCRFTSEVDESRPLFRIIYRHWSFTCLLLFFFSNQHTANDSNEECFIQFISSRSSGIVFIIRLKHSSLNQGKKKISILFFQKKKKNNNNNKGLFSVCLMYSTYVGSPNNIRTTKKVFSRSPRNLMKPHVVGKYTEQFSPY